MTFLGDAMLRKLLAMFRNTVMGTEYVTETREGMDNIADAIRTLAGVMASCAASTHTDTLGDQRNMAGVIFADASARFGDILRKLDDRKRVELETYITGLCKGKR